jgi:hypothetical protein
LWGFLATWRSGYAAACKAVYTGSIPVVALRMDPSYSDDNALSGCGRGVPSGLDVIEGHRDGIDHEGARGDLLGELGDDPICRERALATA